LACGVGRTEGHAIVTMTMALRVTKHSQPTVKGSARLMRAGFEQC